MAIDEVTSGTEGTITVPVDGELLIGIGDLHGHFPALETLMDKLHEKYFIFQNRDRLVLRNDVNLAFTGDYIDRGESALKIIETLRTLTENNPNQVHTLMGNHELLALLCYDYAKEVSPELDRYEYCIHGSNGGVKFVGEFGDNPETALQNYIERMSNKGDIGEWTRNLEPCFLADFNGKKIMFAHGDIPHTVGSAEDIRKFIAEYKDHMLHGTMKHGGTAFKYGKKELTGEGTFFWNRRFEGLRQSEAEWLLADLKVDFIVGGHTPHKKITSYFDKIFDIDVGMTQAYGANEPAAIIFKKDGVYGFYTSTGEEALVRYETEPDEISD